MCTQRLVYTKTIEDEGVSFHQKIFSRKNIEMSEVETK